MSIHRSYFKKNNTVVENSEVNTGRNPVTQLFYGGSGGNSYSRFIFDINLTDLRAKYINCCVKPENLTHKLKMTNTSNFDDTLINNSPLMDGTRRATSFTLQLFKVTDYEWSEGVGYDYQVPHIAIEPEYNTTQSNRPSNWFKPDTLNNWLVPGTYDNTVTPSFGGVWELLATQKFDHGDENIEFSNVALDLEIANRLMSPVVTNTIYGVSFIPGLENITGTTESYSVGFFSRHTQTFFEPFLESTINNHSVQNESDVINDDRGNFNLNSLNRLFLYLYDDNGTPICLDRPPKVEIKDCDGTSVATLVSRKLTCCVYYIDYSLSNIPQVTPVQYTDTWIGLRVNGVPLPNVTNEFIIYDEAYTIGTTISQPKIYGYSVSGIKEDEKIKNGDIRKIYVSAREPYTTNRSVLVNNIQYRLYVREGNTQVEVIPWTMVNMTFTDNYFLLDTSWMIPNEYHLDIKSTSNQQVDTYSKVIKFQIVNEK